MKGKYLITTDNWFFAPDGVQYNCVWGNVAIVSDSILGIKTNVRSSNWFAKIGTEDNHVIIAGCQIHYACRSENRPDAKMVDDYAIEAGEVKNYRRPVRIYIAE